MKYLGALILFLCSYFVYAFVFNTSWHWLNPFLLSLIFIYYVSGKPLVYYGTALLFGLTLDAFMASFGLNTLSFLLVVFMISNLQLTIFTSKNTGTIILLTFLASIFFYIFFWFFYWLTGNEFYTLTWQTSFQMLRFVLLDTLLVVIFYVLYFNLWLKKNERRSF